MILIWNHRNIWKVEYACDCNLQNMFYCVDQKFEMAAMAGQHFNIKSYGKMQK
jgi:hypothetical protein